MNETRRTNRPGMVALLSVILGVGILFAGCDKAPQGEKKPPTVVPTKPPSKAVLPEKDLILIGKVEACDDLFVLHDMKEAYEQSEAIDRAFADKWTALTKEMNPQTLIKGLDILAVNTKATGEKEYTFSFLLSSTADLDTDYHLSVFGFVFLPNAKYLPEGQQKRLHVGWNRVLNDDPTSQWKRDEYHVVHLKAKTDHLIPYNLRLCLHTRTEQGRWAANVGTRLVLGWQWDILDEEFFVAKIKACDDFASLYAIAPAGPKMSAPVAQALEKKWNAITSSMTPQTMIKGLDFLAIDMKPAGEDKTEFSVLLRTTADIDTDYQVAIVGRVDPSHKSKLSEAARRMRDRKIWSVLSWDHKEAKWKEDDVSTWKANEYHVLSLIATAVHIPYDLSMTLQIWDNGKWAANVGNPVELGWYVALED